MFQVGTCTHKMHCPELQPGKQVNTTHYLKNETRAYVGFIKQSIPATDKKLEEIVIHQTEDPVCQEIRQYVEEGWPDKSRITGL